jgi:hypothetical protein
MHGAAFRVTLSVEDAYGNIVTGYTAVPGGCSRIRTEGAAKTFPILFRNEREPAGASRT